MIAQPFVLDVGLGQRGVPRPDRTVVAPKGRRTFLNVAAAVFVGWTMIVLGVVMSARTGATPQVPDLPQRFLPGNPLPSEASCVTLSDEHIPRCVVHLADYDVYFNFDADTRIICRTVIPAQQYTLGELIAAWGNPSGLTRNNSNIYIRWGTRSALLYAGTFGPNSRVDFILYDLEGKQAAPWLGFTSAKRRNINKGNLDLPVIKTSIAALSGLYPVQNWQLHCLKSDGQC